METDPQPNHFRQSAGSAGRVALLLAAVAVGCGLGQESGRSGSGGKTATGTGGPAAAGGGPAGTGGAGGGQGSPGGASGTAGASGAAGGASAGATGSAGRFGGGGSAGRSGGGGGSGVGGAPAASGGASGASGGAGGASGGSSGGVCERWKADRADLSEGSWTGSVAACDPGDVTGAGRANALRQVNLFRFLAGLPAVTEDSTKSMNAQACALLEHANKMLSHEPPTTWSCYMTAGATAAGQSNIATTAGVRAVDLYMNDRGNETTIGHRRWLLSNSLGPVGLGSTSGYSCLMTIGGTGKAGKAYAAWPPPGDVPLQALTVEGSLDKVGWSIQSDTINLASAKVTITDAGTDRPVTVMQLPANYGSKYAISLVPMGWSTTAGHTYEVAVTGTPTAIDYAVNVVSCP